MSLIGRLFPSASPHLREAATKDAPALARLHALSFHRGWGVDEFERLLTDRAALGHVSCEGPRGPVAGFVLSHVVPPEAEILSIAIAPAARRRGRGGQLLAHHLARLAARGITVSFLEVDAANAAAIALYRRFGYVEAGRRKGYYQAEGGSADALVMRRDF